MGNFVICIFICIWIPLFFFIWVLFIYFCAQILVWPQSIIWWRILMKHNYLKNTHETQLFSCFIEEGFQFSNRLTNSSVLLVIWPQHILMDCQPEFIFWFQYYNYMNVKITWSNMLWQASINAFVHQWTAIRSISLLFSFGYWQLIVVLVLHRTLSILPYYNVI